MNTRPILEMDENKDIKCIHVINPNKAILVARSSDLANGLYSVLGHIVIGSRTEGRKGYLFNLATGYKDKNTSLFAQPSESIIISDNLKQAFSLFSKFNLISEDTLQKLESQIEQVNKELYEDTDLLKTKENTIKPVK